MLSCDVVPFASVVLSMAVVHFVDVALDREGASMRRCNGTEKNNRRIVILGYGGDLSKATDSSSVTLEEHQARERTMEVLPPGGDRISHVAISVVITPGQTIA